MVDLYAPLFTQIPCWGFYSGDGAGANEGASRFTMKYIVPSTGAIATLAITSADYLELISQTSECSVSSAQMVVFDGADNNVDTGEEIFLGRYATTTMNNFTLGVPRRLQLGTYPKLKSLAGTTPVYRVIVYGWLYQARA